MPAPRTLQELLPELLAAAGAGSLRQLAARVGCSPSFLSRVVRGQKRPTPELLEAVAAALGVDPGRFTEYRELRAVEAVRRDAALRDRIYRQLG